MRGVLLALSLVFVAGAGLSPPVHADDSEQQPLATPAPQAEKRQPNQVAAEAHYKRARQLYQLGRYREAIAQLEAALRLDPEGAELLYNVGLVHEKLGEVDEAIAAYRKYLRVLGPDADREEVKKINEVIRRLEGAKSEVAAREAKRMEHRLTPLTTGLIATAGISLLATAYFGLSALADDRRARDFTVGTDGGTATRDHLISTSKREAIFADVAGALALGSGIAAFALYFTSEFPKRDNPSEIRRAALRLQPIARGGAVRFEVTF